jgi:hypothetical protein
MQDLTDGAKQMTISEDTEKTEKERLDLFYEYAKKRRDNSQLDNVSVHKELAAEAQRLDVQQKAPLILAELLFSANIVSEVKKHRNLLLRFTHDDTKAQKYLLGGLEQVISLHSAKLMEKIPGILKVLNIETNTQQIEFSIIFKIIFSCSMITIYWKKKLCWNGEKRPARNMFLRKYPNKFGIKLNLS